MDTLKFIKCRIRILHPFDPFKESLHYTKEIEVDYEGEALNGIPHGIGFLYYIFNSNVNNWQSFRGFAQMQDGQIHGGYALFIAGDNFKYSFTYM